ncbi:MAG: hypothetical protein MR424_02180 [Treponema sp.]|nr:hypothetical protein [Treponema sp.]
MFGFLLKKNFCDGWDNLLSVVIVNVVFLFAGFGVVFLNIFARATDAILIKILAFTISFIVLSILAFAYGDSAAKIANFEGIHILDYFKAIPGVLKDASLFGLLVSVIILLTTFSIKYYFTQSESMFGFMLGAAIVWIDVFFFLSLIWFIPIRSLMHNNFKKCLKKSFIIFFDNTGFTLAIAVYNLVLIALSVLFVGFIPSIAGILIANTNALRLRLYKYDYLEEHPELTTKKERKHIPWEELIYDDREALGPRKFKSFIFPWKND